MDRHLIVLGRDFHRRVLGAGRGPADQQRRRHPPPLHLAGDMDHLVQARRDQPTKPDQIGPALDGRLPTSAEDFEDWAVRARPEPETFICGPEVWGEGRTVAARPVSRG